MQLHIEFSQEFNKEPEKTEREHFQVHAGFKYEDRNELEWVSVIFSKEEYGQKGHHVCLVDAVIALTSGITQQMLIRTDKMLMNPPTATVH